MSISATGAQSRRTKHFSWRNNKNLLTLALLILIASPTTQAGNAEKDALIKQGRYLTQIAGCNDCHTPGYMESGGTVPESTWLTGDVLGWNGPWGTTYASNLRLILPKLSEADWLKLAKNTQYRPPMPWFALRDMSERDLRAIYQFVKQLGPAGNPAPAYLPPGKTPTGPYVLFPTPPAE